MLKTTDNHKRNEETTLEAIFMNLCKKYKYTVDRSDVIQTLDILRISISNFLDYKIKITNKPIILNICDGKDKLIACEYISIIDGKRNKIVSAINLADMMKNVSIINEKDADLIDIIKTIGDRKYNMVFINDRNISDMIRVYAIALKEYLHM